MPSHSPHFSSHFSATGPWDQILPKPLLPTHLERTAPTEGSDAFWMTEAWLESMKNHGLTRPNPAVGCVLVNAAGKEISRGLTQPFPGLHAEKVAMDRVIDPTSLIGATAYVTLEPCSHIGRNPPCADLLAKSPIQRIVIARTDPNSLVQGQGIEKLRASGKQVVLGALSHEISAWNLGFFVQHTLKRPLIALKWAQTLDGQLADDTMKSHWISGPISRAYTHWLRQNYDLILVGAQTVLNDFPRLDVRDCNLPHQGEPLPILFDPKGLLLKASREIQTLLKNRTLLPHRKHVIVTTQTNLKANSKSWVHDLENVILLGQPGQKLIEELMQIIQGPEVTKALGRDVQSIMIEGGSKTLSHWISAGYGDIFHTFIAPVLTGGDKNRVTARKLLSQASRLHTLASAQLESDILIEMISQEIKERIFS